MSAMGQSKTYIDKKITLNTDIINDIDAIPCKSLVDRFQSRKMKGIDML